MALHFIKNPDPDNFNVVHHIDEAIDNWNLDNLQWTDQLGNVRAHMQYRKKTGKIVKGKRSAHRIVQYDKKTMQQIKMFDDGPSC